jgi:flap endonuclease-1
MGVNKLRDIVTIDETRLAAYEGEVCAVDAHNWIYKYMSVQTRYLSEEKYTTSEGTEVPNLIGLLKGLPTLLNASITPLFVFDGAPSELKTDEIERRREQRKQAEEKLAKAKENGDINAIRKYRTQTNRLTEVILDSSKVLLDLLGIPYVMADGAGEGYAARLATDDSTPVTGVLSSDYDTVLFGSPETIRSFSGEGPAEVIDLMSTKTTRELTQTDLINIAICIGTDYNSGIHGIGPKRALNRVTNGETISDIIEDTGAELRVEDAVEIQDVFLTPPDGESPSRYELQSMKTDEITEYLVDVWQIDEQTVRKNLSRFHSH